MRVLFITTIHILIPAFVAASYAQSGATLFGRVFDPTGSVVQGAAITVRNQATGEERTAQTDEEGNYQHAALPAATYRIEVSAPGFQILVVENVLVDVGRTLLQDFRIRIGSTSEQVTVTTNAFMIELGTSSVGHVIDGRAVQEIPLNGRYFLDLGLLVPGSITSSTSGFSTTPSRGLGSLAINTAGNREETVNYLINGITLNNQVFSSISFQPSISTVQEFKIDNSTFSAQYGQNSGAVVNIATRSGTSEFHGEMFEFLRNDVLDARNFFNFMSHKPPPFKRSQFGGSVGGPIADKKTFFYASYEGLRQRQFLDLNSLVLSDSQRAAVIDPATAKLLRWIPRANFIDSSGMPRFSGSATAPVNDDQGTVDISHKIGGSDRVHGYYAFQRAEINQPNLLGNTIPGFGHYYSVKRQILTLNETHSFRAASVNQVRLGFNRIRGTNTPNAQLNPADFGINDGVRDPIGLPQIMVAGGLNFGGPAGMPSGRADTTVVVSDSFSYLRGRHSIKLGGEYRQFLTNGFARDTGRINFPSVQAFLDGIADSFSVTLGTRSSSISQGALGLFVQDNYKWRRNLTLELGLRYEWNMTPTERYDRFIVFDEKSASLWRVGRNLDRIYRQNDRNLQPRVGFAWDPFGDEKTAIRAAYAIQVDEPLTSIVTGTSANPPLAMPLTFTGTIRFDNAITLARAAGLAPQTVDQGYSNAYLQSWNINVQREVTSGVAVMAGYFGSKATNLVLRRNINQPVNGVRPYAAVSPSSEILPGIPIGNITKIEGTGNSSYNALWTTATRRITRGLQFNAFYTWSKSIDYNSLSSGGVVAQNSYDIRGERGPSDFDVRHRFVINSIYDFPFKRNQFVEGWQLTAIVQSQSGSPVNIIASNPLVNGVANTLRPDVRGPVKIIGSVDRWFDSLVFVPVDRFGNLGRNVITGPRFNNTDLSLSKNTTMGDRMRIQFRVEFFDVFNHANFGQPGNIVGSPNFGRITATRFPTGESGSSRQVQFAMKLLI